ncbi:MAG: YqjF family protein [Saprospiraceae bacterium]|mgnify:CR=1 FL=1
MSFLNAEWRKLVLANYEVDPNILEKYIPAHTELDTWNGRCYVSLVGFMFVNTKMLGMKIPFHINFEEVNLRFYVKHKSNGEYKRGVVFIKEIVPLPAITLVANTLYKEHYETQPMRHKWESNDKNQIVSYEWKNKKSWQEITVKADIESQVIEAGSEAEFITEHYWGYTKINENKTFEYEVTHPVWEIYPVQQHCIHIDFGEVYGRDFEILNTVEPTSVMLAEGSTITVEKVNRIKPQL